GLGVAVVGQRGQGVGGAPAQQQAALPAPTGKAYVVQLGALKNADKVNEIVGKLRASGFKVYTSPSTPVQGKITRILVG
ncbi:SPOR domain-containing protein, partial [Escherichia coli]|nr:SPOR domain-containing protein [Escherichia coli]